MLNIPFVPNSRTPLCRAQIGLLVPDAAAIQLKDETHIERIFTSAFGGGTAIDFKGFTITGTITAYVKRSGPAPMPVSNLPARYSRPRIKIWLGGYYAEGVAAITDISVAGITKAFTVIDIAFESDGLWVSYPNVVELP